TCGGVGGEGGVETGGSDFSTCAPSSPVVAAAMGTLGIDTSETTAASASTGAPPHVAVPGPVVTSGALPSGPVFQALTSDAFGTETRSRPDPELLIREGGAFSATAASTGSSAANASAASWKRGSIGRDTQRENQVSKPGGMRSAHLYCAARSEAVGM